VKDNGSSGLPDGLHRQSWEECTSIGNPDAPDLVCLEGSFEKRQEAVVDWIFVRVVSKRVELRSPAVEGGIHEPTL
jgi:hypothetical protein